MEKLQQLKARLVARGPNWRNGLSNWVCPTPSENSNGECDPCGKTWWGNWLHIACRGDTRKSECALPQICSSALLSSCKCDYPWRGGATVYTLPAEGIPAKLSCPTPRVRLCRCTCGYPWMGGATLYTLPSVWTPAEVSVLSSRLGLSLHKLAVQRLCMAWSGICVTDGVPCVRHC